MVRNESSKVTKRRGRPPKSVAMTPNDAPKRRGRPRKTTVLSNVPVNTMVAAGVPTTLTNAAAMAKRGRANASKKPAPKVYFVYNFDADATFIVMANDGQTARTQVYELMQKGVKLDAFDSLRELAASKGCSARVLLKTEVITHVSGNIYHMS